MKIIPLIIALWFGLFVTAFFLRRRTSVIDFYSPMDFDDFERKRMKLYLRGLETKQHIKVREHSTEFREFVSFDKTHRLFFEKHEALLGHQNSETIYDLNEIYRRFNVETKAFVRMATWADSITWHEQPTISKARHIYAQSMTKRFCVLLRLRSRMHFAPIQIDPIPFDQKKNVVIWRGGPSGPGFLNEYPQELLKPSREDCLKRWCHDQAVAPHEIDVGLTKKWRYEKFKQYVKPDLSITEMMGYKYLLSIEGNDVATNLKWALASNSVVMMPKPRCESWFAESLLRPYIHYVPIKDDFSDLHAQKQWCDTHPDECKRIVAFAQEFVRPFRNIERDYYLSFRVLQRYMQLVHVEIEK